MRGVFRSPGASVPWCLAALLVSGCAMHTDIVHLQQQLEQQRKEAQRSDSVIAASVSGLARLLQSVSDSVTAQQSFLAQMRGDTRIALYNVQQQLVAIQELTGQSQQRLSELRGQLEGQRQSVAPTTAATPAPAGSAPATAAGSQDPTPEQLIEISVAQLRRGSPGAARVGFAEFVRRYPTHARMADVLFFTGESWAAEQQTDSAAAAYRAVVQRFPQSPRAPSSLYKLGMQSLAAGRTTEARDRFARVVSTWPQSDEAALARDRLRTLPAR